MSNEIVKTNTATNNDLFLYIIFYNNSKIESKVDRTCKKQNKINFYSWKSRKCVYGLWNNIAARQFI